MNDMKITGKEIGHILRDFILWIMLVVCVIVNCYLVFSSSLYRNEVAAVEQAIEKVGAVANAEALEQLEKLCSDELNSKGKLTKSKTTDDVARLNTWQTMVDTYRADLEKGEIKHFNAVHITPIGELIYEKIFPALFIEGLIIGIYVVMRGIERGNTEAARSILYTTRCGRNLAMYKFLSNVIVVIITFFLLSVMTFLMLFSHYPLTHTLNAPFAADLTCSEQIVSCCALVLGAVLVIMLLTQGIGLIIRNIYGGAAVTACGISAMLLSSLTKNKWLKLNPVQLLASSVRKSGKVKIIYHFNTLFSSNENVQTILTVLAVYLCIGIVLFTVGNYIFRRREIR